MGKLPRLIGRRLWQLLPIIVFATFVVFSLLQLVPGDPAVVLAGDYASEQRIAEIRQIYGLDQPFVVQYGVWLLHALEGNLGRSLLTSQPVSELILYRLPNTILIAVYALVIAGRGRRVARCARGHPGRHTARLHSSLGSPRLVSRCRVSGSP